MTIMANRINATDYDKLRTLAKESGKTVKFKYIDGKGKQTDVNAQVDVSTVREDSILTNGDNGYRRYLFGRIQSDVTVE